MQQEGTEVRHNKCASRRCKNDYKSKVSAWLLDCNQTATRHSLSNFSCRGLSSDVRYNDDLAVRESCKQSDPPNCSVMLDKIVLKSENRTGAVVEKLSSLELQNHPDSSNAPEYESRKTDTADSGLMKTPRKKRGSSDSAANRKLEKFKKDPNLLQPSSSWSCLICTFENVRTAVTCAKCANVRRKETLVQENAASDQWYAIVSSCFLTKTLFVDETFPPSPSSLYYNPKERKDVEEIKWVRIRNVSADEVDNKLHWALFRDEVKLSDLCQGELGDCWLISALAVLAEQVDLLRKVMITKHLCPQGAYEVRICKDGVWKVVLVDDLVPCDKKLFPLYCQVVRKQLWMLLIEKAMAKLHGCYEALTNGSITEALATLTGAPCENILLHRLRSAYNEDADLVWARLLSFRESNYLMGTVCSAFMKNLSEEEYTFVGLHLNHIYSVLDVRSVAGHRLLQLRDPIGDLGWKGDWSYNSYSWTAAPELQEILLQDGMGDDTFWISYSDLLKYFQSVGVCKIKKDWAVTTLHGVLPPLSTQKPSGFLFSVTEVTELDVVLHQESQRNMEVSKRSKLDLCLLLFKKLGTCRYTLIQNSSHCVEIFVTLDALVDPGEYLIVPLAFNHWHRNGHFGAYPKYVLNIHSSKVIQIEQTPTSLQDLREAIISLAKLRGKQTNFNNATVYSLTENFAGLLIVVENRHQKKYFRVKYVNNSEECNVMSTRKAFELTDCVPPLHQQVVAVFSQFKGSLDFEPQQERFEYEFLDVKWTQCRLEDHVPPIDTADCLHVPLLMK